jgi:hypothetical protein
MCLHLIGPCLLLITALHWFFLALYSFMAWALAPWSPFWGRPLPLLTHCAVATWFLPFLWVPQASLGPLTIAPIWPLHGCFPVIIQVSAQRVPSPQRSLCKSRAVQCFFLHGSLPFWICFSPLSPSLCEVTMFIDLLILSPSPPAQWRQGICLRFILINHSNICRRNKWMIQQCVH